jgi:hypothetical protein
VHEDFIFRTLAHGGLRDHPDAIDDLQRSLKLLKESGQSGSRTYFLTQVSYAQVLREAGMKDEALRTEREAKTALEGLRRQQCGACTGSVESLR